jgi:Fur family ferric uptake transcriptional regulator
VADVLATFADFRSAQEIHQLLGRRGQRVGLATVYRTLQRLADAGEIDVLRTEDGEAIYRRCSVSHHHHLVCRSCGAVADVDCAVGAAPCLEPSDAAGFVVDEAEVVFWGLCRDCQNENTNTSRRGEA